MCSNREPVDVEELHALSGPQLRDRTRALVAERNRIDAELARTVRVADRRQAFAADGQATAASWLRGHCRLSRAAAAQVVRNGRAVEQLPAVEQQFAAGALSADQVDLIGRITGPKYAPRIEAQGGSVAGIGQILGSFATDRPHDELVTALHRLLERLDQDGPEPDPTEARFLTMARHADGSVTGRFHLDALGGERLQAALESILQANRPAGDERTRAQQQADALVQLCDIHLACGTLPLLRTTKAQVAVKIGSDDLADPATGGGAADLGSGGIVSAATARQVACDADLRRYLIDLDGELLDLGRRPRCRGPRRAREAWGAAGSLHSPAAAPPPGGPTSTTSSTGSSAARPRWPTPRCSANATTPRSTTASASSATPPGDGTPTAETAPRSSPSAPHPATTNPRWSASAELAV